MSQAVDELYICQSAATAIVSQVSRPLRMSSDALQNINRFLDEFIMLLLLQTNKPFDPSKLKQACFQLLPNMLGKNALLEAELQVKDMRLQSDINDDDIRKKCVQHCTLSAMKKSSSHDWIVVYLTSMIEHIGEYILNCIANYAEDYIGVKDVYFALKQDNQLALLFSRMDLHDRIAKRVVSVAMNNTRPRSCYLPQKRYTKEEDFSFDDLDLEQEEEKQQANKRQTTNTIQPIKYRQPPRVQSVYAPDYKAINFEDLIKSNNTVKVSLTPNRLKSIESNETTNESFFSRSRRSTLASLKRIASTVKRPASSPVIKKPTSNESIQHTRPTSSPPPIQQKSNEIQEKARISSLASPHTSSDMSIPSLSETTTTSHYSTSSIASTLSNTSIGKELSTIGEQKIMLNAQQEISTIMEETPTTIKEASTVMKEAPSVKATIQQKVLERPSSIVARRAHRLGNARPKSYHESQAAEKYNIDIQNTGVLDKVMRFEMASKRDKFLYIQPTTRKRPVDRAVQTDEVEEEWFIQDDLDEQDEADIVEWLLGE